MAKAPTRPPTYRAGRRPQKGPRLVAGSIRDRLTAAAAELKQAGHHDSANAVESVLAPGGWELLRRAGGHGATSPLTISVDTQVKAALQDAAQEFGVTIRVLAEEAYRKVLAGEWLPPKAGQRKGTVKAVLNVSVDAELRKELREQLPRLSEQEGRRISEGGIVMAWACDQLGVDTGASMLMGISLPDPLRDHFTAARDAGEPLEAIVDERIRQLVDGSWSLPRPARMKKGTWDNSPWSMFKIRVDDQLRNALHEMAPQLSEELGVRVFPGTIVRQILIDRLGEPAE